MFQKKENPLDQQLDEAIISIHNEMKVLTSDDADYAKMTTQLERLHHLKTPSPEAVSLNTLLLIGGNLAGILMIIGFEKSHVMTSKALGFLGKLR